MKKSYFLAFVAAVSFSAIVQAQNVIGRFNYDSLHASNVLCTYGTYQYFNNYSGIYLGPYANVGILDSGQNNYGHSYIPGSRHTIHTDTTLLDTTSNFNLRCVPQGFSTAVRLGCLHGAYLCQAISYSLVVDTALNGMLALDIACVSGHMLEHPRDRGARLFVEIIDTLGNQLGNMDITPTISTSSGSVNNLPFVWDTGTSIYNMYMDWTPVGINLQPFHGKNITLRLATFHCGQGGGDHGGYAYFTAKYGDFLFSTTTSATKSNSITFRAPDGFMKYEWRLNSAPTSVFDTLPVVEIPYGEYFSCTVTDYFGNTKTLSSKAVARRPHSDFSHTISQPNSNTNILHLTNLATLIDTATQTPSTDLEEFLWIIDTNNLCYQFNPVFEVDTGWHTVSLITRCGSTAMSDTMTRSIYVSGNSGISTTQKAELKIYPNPAKDLIHIDGETIEKVEVIDHIGRVAIVERGKNDINVAKLPAGNYILRMQTTDRQVVLRNFIKK